VRYAGRYSSLSDFKLPFFSCPSERQREQKIQRQDHDQQSKRYRSRRRTFIVIIDDEASTSRKDGADNQKNDDNQTTTTTTTGESSNHTNVNTKTFTAETSSQDEGGVGMPVIPKK
jgi:hypothetical protein